LNCPTWSCDLASRNTDIPWHRAVSDHIHNIADSIACFSRWYTFRPGDTLFTSKPAEAGCGHDPKVFLKAGDLLEVEVTRPGTLATRIAAQ
jgi:acylpyruvate hydrolase